MFVANGSPLTLPSFVAAGKHLLPAIAARCFRSLSSRVLFGRSLGEIERHALIVPAYAKGGW